VIPNSLQNEFGFSVLGYDIGTLKFTNSCSRY